MAANATLASGHVDLVMIPEVFEGMDKPQVEAAIETYVRHLETLFGSEFDNPHAVMVLAEGVAQIFAECEAEIGGFVGRPTQFP